jgi:hypothetical protein
MLLDMFINVSKYFYMLPYVSLCFMIPPYKIFFVLSCIFVFNVQITYVILLNYTI